ncbi:hypothetical protein J7L36_01370 [bacterium]|nr:hypothetical protein [bacterium]
MKIKKNGGEKQPVMVAFPMKDNPNGLVLRLSRGIDSLELLQEDRLIGFKNKTKGSKTLIKFYPPLKKAGK